jgi:phage-related protein (TIGR01555 family)
MKLIQQTISMVRAAVMDKDAGEEYSRQFSTVTGLDTLWDRLAHSVAKAARQPMTKLFGMSPSGLATDDESGRAHWRQQISAFQEKLRPLLEQYYAHVNGGPVVIRFKPQDEATAREEAEIRKMNAETRKIYVEIAAARPDEFRKKMVEEGLISDLDIDADLEGDPYAAPEAPAPEAPAPEAPAPEAPAPEAPAPEAPTP